MSNKLKVKCGPEASGFIVCIIAKEDGKPAVQVTEAKTIRIPIPGAEVTVDLFRDLSWNTAPRAEKGIIYVVRVVSLGASPTDQSEVEGGVASRDISVTGKDVAKWKKATAPTPTAPTPAKPATQAPTVGAKPAPTPAKPTPTPPAPGGKVLKFPVTYWNLRRRLAKTVKNRLEELRDFGGNTEFWAESEDVVSKFKALSADKKMPTAEEVQELRDKVEDLLVRMHAKCEEVRVRAPKLPEATATGAKPTPTPVVVPAVKPVPPVIPAASVVASVTVNAQATANKAVTPPKQPTTAQTAPTTAPKAPTVQATPPVTPKPAPVLPTITTLKPTTQTKPGTSQKMTWVEWLIVGLIVAGLIIAGCWQFSKKSPASKPISAASSVVGFTTNVVTANKTNHNTSVVIAKTTNGDGPTISVSGAISVGDNNSGTVIGVQNNTYNNYFYGDKEPKKVVGGCGNAIGKEQTSNVEKVLRIPGWKPWPTVDCSRLVLVPRPEVVDGEIEKTLWLEDGQIAVLDTPLGCHYWYQESGEVTALEGIDEFCHEHVDGLVWPQQVKDRDKRIGVKPIYRLWLIPKNGKAMSLHLKLIRDF